MSDDENRLTWDHLWAVEAERDSLRRVVQAVREALDERDPTQVAPRIRAALAAAADAPQPEQPKPETRCVCGHDAALHAESEERACTESNDRDWYCPCPTLRIPSPAVLPDSKEQL